LSKRIDLTKQRFGRLVVISAKEQDTHGMMVWECKCDCGKTSYIRSGDLRPGKVVSCGCYSRDIARERATKHHLSNDRLYCIYNNMVARCHRKSNKSFKDYGARGIGICKEWDNNFPAFAKWALESGYKSNLTIERKDVNKGYSPENCTWITNEAQAINRRTTHWVTYKGETMPLSYLAQKVGVTRQAIRDREDKFNKDYEAIVNDILSSKKHTSRKEI